METMSKGDFAAHINVSAGRISQYIADGKIFGDAIEGEGRRAKIRTAVALGQLSKTLDPSQRFGANGGVRIQMPAMTRPATPASPAMLPLTAPTSPTTDPVVDELAAERLKQQRLQTAKLEREEAASIGRYILTDAARRETGRAVTEAFKVMDKAIQEMAKKLAADFALPERDALLALHKVMRDVRSQQAAEFRAEIENIDRLVEDVRP